MHEDLDLSVIERHHDADPQFHEAVRTRLVAVLDGSDALDVADHLPVQSTEEEATMIDLETPSETDEPRTGPNRVLLAGLLVAAAVATIALVATRDNDATPADQPSPTVTVPPTVPPRVLSDAQGELEPGTYFVDEVEGTPTPRIFVTIGAGWYGSGSQQSLVFNSTVGSVAFGRPATVFSDACHPSGGYHPGAVTTLDGLVTALTEQQGWAAVTEPSDISIDGYPGKAFRRTALADMVDCDRGTVSRNRHDANFRSWENPDGQGGGGDYYEPATIETLRVVDIDGTVVVISTRLWEPTAAASEELAAALDSIRIERA